MEKKTALLEINYTIKHQVLKQSFEREQNQLDMGLKKKSIEFENNLMIKKEEHQKELTGYLDYLRKENEWFALNQEQAKISLESKEKKIFLEVQEKQENFELKKQELNNQLDYEQILTNIKETKVLKTGSLILFLATLSIAQLTFSSPQLIGKTILPILIVCVTSYLFVIHLVEGKKEKEQKQLFDHNQFLIEQTAKLKEEVLFIEEDLKNIMNEKINAEKSDRSFADYFRFLDIMQKDLKESEMKRKVLESENIALRKYLLIKRTLEN
jgi:hypothetical protein